MINDTLILLFQSGLFLISLLTLIVLNIIVNISSDSYRKNLKKIVA
ncbi:hypothetical protein BCM20_003243 [Clostridium beijerinckii]|nr:putative holin-like toxin [Clostridium beijerinckii]NOW03570.1 hypothetical protein [Clostridium beijerinckii]NYC03288.1 hypothetical protein [Clostridium beijerinckii]